MMIRRWMLPIGLCAAIGLCRIAAAETPGRTFLFTYAVTITGLASHQPARIWIPVPVSDAEQDIRRISQNLPVAAQEGTESEYGNRMLYLQAQASADGTIPLSLVYRVTRLEASEAADAPDAMEARYLRADQLVPVGGKPLKLLAQRRLPGNSLALGRFLYDLVGDHMEYRKDKPGWGRGDAEWACDSGFGNCTDFHSLFIALARSEHMPARFEIGFGIPRTRGKGTVAGYHCWARFKPKEHGWVPVDISEADQDPARRDYFFGHLCENRVRFTTGRDLELAPRQDGPRVNFLVYPYVEVDGRPYPADRLEKHFSYEDVPADARRG